MFYIIFEGPDFSGKTTLLEETKKLIPKDKKILITKEPGGSGELSNQIRDILLYNNTYVSKYAELFLYLADRAQLYDYLLELSKSQENDDLIILQDRNFMSTFVYQGKVKGIDLTDLANIHYLFEKEYKNVMYPDVMFLIEVSEKTIKERMEKRMLDKIEQKVLTDNVQKILDGYSLMYDKFNKLFNIVVLNGENPVSENVKEVCQCLTLKYQNKNKRREV